MTLMPSKALTKNRHGTSFLKNTSQNIPKRRQKLNVVSLENYLKDGRLLFLVSRLLISPNPLANIPRVS
jgi:hypothetical protein